MLHIPKHTHPNHFHNSNWGSIFSGLFRPRNLQLFPFRHIVTSVTIVTGLIFSSICSCSSVVFSAVVHNLIDPFVHDIHFIKHFVGNLTLKLNNKHDSNLIFIVMLFKIDNEMSLALNRTTSCFCIDHQDNF